MLSLFRYEYVCTVWLLCGGLVCLCSVRYDSFTMLFVEGYCDHLDLHVLTHSFPTRRSSDLHAARIGDFADDREVQFPLAEDGFGKGFLAEAIFRKWRSEEHTSELQSLMRISYAVFCLKKKPTSALQSQRQNSSPIHDAPTRNINYSAGVGHRNTSRRK